MSSNRRVLHLVRSGTWPEELRGARESETVIALTGAEAPSDCAGRVIDGAGSPEAIFDLIFDHDIVLTW